jgi:hypothetical protein
MTRGKARRTAADEAEIEALRKAGFKIDRAWALKEAAILWQCSTAKDALMVFNKVVLLGDPQPACADQTSCTDDEAYLYGILIYTRHPFTNAASACSVWKTGTALSRALVRRTCFK